MDPPREGRLAGQPQVVDLGPPPGRGRARTRLARAEPIRWPIPVGMVRGVVEVGGCVDAIYLDRRLGDEATLALGSALERGRQPVALPVSLVLFPALDVGHLPSPPRRSLPVFIGP